MNLIYVLKLKDNKYFIHFDENKQDYEIITECIIYYDYLKKYTPISIIEKKIIMDFLDIDKTVKNYMYLYGYNNVRGGSYIDEKLTDYFYKTLYKELTFVERQELEWSYTFKEILEKYQYNDEFKTVEEIDKEIENINKEFLKYGYEKSKYEQYVFFNVNGKKQKITDFIPENMEWIYDICMLSYANIINLNIYDKEIRERYNMNYIEKYKSILLFLKRVYELFEENDLFSKFCIEKNVYLKYPNFIFDNFIYNTHNKDIKKLLEICKTFQFMGNILHNIIDELKFDVNSYGFSYEWKVPRIIYILEKKREKLLNPKLIFDDTII